MNILGIYLRGSLECIRRSSISGSWAIKSFYKNKFPHKKCYPANSTKKNVAPLGEIVLYTLTFPFCLVCQEARVQFKAHLQQLIDSSWLAYLSSPFIFRSAFFFSVFVNCILLYWVGQNFHSDDMKEHFGQRPKLSEILLGRKQDINSFRKKIGLCLAYNTEKL